MNCRDLSKWEKYYVKRLLTYKKVKRQGGARTLNVDGRTIERMIKRHQIDLESPEPMCLALK
jgi:IS30 family transposase